MLNHRIAALPTAPSHSDLRAVLEERVADRKAQLLSEFGDETRFVFDQLLRGRSMVLFDGSAADCETAEGFEEDDEQGKENLEPEDYFGFEVSIDLTRVAYVSDMVAAACNQRYLQLWRNVA